MAPCGRAGTGTGYSGATPALLGSPCGAAHSPQADGRLGLVPADDEHGEDEGEETAAGDTHGDGGVRGVWRRQN